MTKKLRQTGQYLLLLLCLGPFSLGAQDFPRDRVSHKIIYAEEVPVMDGPKTDLYYRAKAWLLAAGGHKNTLQVDNATQGLLIGTFYSRLSVPAGSRRQSYRLWHTVRIELEDDRFWYRIYDLQLQKESSPAAPGPPPRRALEAVACPPAGKKSLPRDEALLRQVQESLQSLTGDLKKSMF